MQSFAMFTKHTKSTEVNVVLLMYLLSFTAPMPPFQPRENTLNSLGRRLCSQEICPICVIVTPHTPQCWDSQREMCRLCAMNTAENKGHRRVHLTLRLPPRAHKTCALCEQRYIVPLSNLNDNQDPATMRCTPCQKHEKCSRCCKIKKIKHFKKERSNNLYKTCGGCREKYMVRTHQNRAQAELQGACMHMLCFCTR